MCIKKHPHRITARSKASDTGSSSSSSELKHDAQEDDEFFKATLEEELAQEKRDFAVITVEHKQKIRELSDMIDTLNRRIEEVRKQQETLRADELHMHNARYYCSECCATVMPWEVSAVFVSFKMVFAFFFFCFFLFGLSVCDMDV